MAMVVSLPEVQVSVETASYCSRGVTYTGVLAGPGSIAVDPRYIPLGSMIFVPGYGTGVADDTGSAVKGWHVDLWLPTCAASTQWGVRTETITVWAARLGPKALSARD